MSDHSSFDIGDAAATRVVLVVALLVSIRLVPVLLDMAWLVLPGLIVIWLIVAVLVGIVQKLLR